MLMPAPGILACRIQIDPTIQNRFSTQSHTSKQGKKMFDLIIRNGTVVDGTGSAKFKADVAIKGATVVSVGEITGDAAREIDATGKIVTPGFIDLHTHSDNSFLIDPLADSKLTQGVTFELMGNCGMSYCAPLSEKNMGGFKERTDKYDPNYKPGWSTMDGYLSALEESGSTINIAAQVGHGTVRGAVMGMEARMPTPEELDRMTGIFAESLDAGALGMSTGLWYGPGSYSLADEVIAVTQPAADRGKLYSSHIRSEADDLSGLFPAHAEAIEVGRRTGARIQISHVKAVGPKFWGRGYELIEGMERARNEGIDVAGDQYPYEWSSTGFSGAMFARWALEGGREKTLERLADSDTRAQVRNDVTYYINRNHSAEGCVIASFPPDQSLEGRSLQDIADEWGCEPEEAALRLYEQSEGSYVLHSMELQDIDSIAKWPLMSIASDGSSLRDEGPLSSGKPHPRSYATNSVIIEQFVEHRGLFSIEEAIHKMTALPASRLALTRRGRIAPGQIADVLVFDPKNVKQHNDFVNPHVYSTGMDYVFVNGKPALENGKPNGTLPGRVMRSLDD
ncbi:amidohydrolase family protein [Candidatus Lucifugimonas marina]|uniref:Amidohydrolase family protein n=2 Tax=Candidatus Lucifugimonas marina TaxID=3038979 RepID=A0AAJ5ZFB8_9CHLR|nr:amidohydrolase family protein [SAR202 cluster bacterium JH702]MDG0868389.1 amidohydrolase family protein [SAR202 cluster bacterium JH639]WFG35024.1 amidohydrolase family protein [SAR202 cluster bacterium JH545]WFG38981.1 amidohydrolase family protein [SAR202 cluster bacterium JH1073]